MMADSTTPLHLAVIPDGNRRWAKKRSLRPWQGHETALRNTQALIEWCQKDPRVGIFTLWGFSTENWRRSQDEVGHLMRLFEDFLQRERASLHTNRTRFVHAGRTDRIPVSLATLIAEVQAETRDYTTFTFQIALDYGGRDEVVRAVRKITAGEPLTEDAFRGYLDHPDIPDIDLVLRTSGEQRTSGFFIWQAAYAEWVFIEKFYPDLVPADLAGALGDYEQRQRRFGA